MTIPLCLVAVLSLAAAAEPAVDTVAPPPAVRVEKIASAALGETREIWVSLPDGYADSGRSYPVVYMMDGENNFTSGVIGGVRQAALLGQLPDFIIVGIRNTDRSKDVFPDVLTFSDGTKSGGRANQYLDFIRDELVPHVAKAYRASDYRVLFGTSNSGFTAVYALFRSPELANAYVAASATLYVPSFQKQRDEAIRAFKGGRRELVLVAGEHDMPTVISQNGVLEEAIAQEKPAGLTCRLAVVEGAEHVPADALVRGLRLLASLPPR